MFFDLIRKRRSIRRFTDAPVETAKIDQIIKAILRAPSSRSLNPWEFVVVDQRRILDRLAACKPHGASFLRQATLGIVICADAAQSDVWVEDASIATIYAHLAATELDLGSCWVQVRKRMADEQQTAAAYIAGLLELPERLTVEAIMAIGYAAENKDPHPTEDLPFDKVHYNRYGGEQRS
jgi:nitroreductase